jgi:outer membrane protein assembly factor BamB
MASAMAKEPNALVHMLVTEREALPDLRSALRKSGLYGRVSAMAWQGPQRPYGDGMVNVLVVADEGTKPTQTETDRVLAPRGTVWTRRGGTMVARRESVPPNVDEWSHSRYDATGNAVSKDKQVGPPKYLQWEAWPRWNHGTKTSCLVSAQGRIFYILDDAHFAASSRTWSLIARDANNGIQLWRRELAGWEGARGGKKVGPAQVHRRLVAVSNRVYATLGEEAPVSVLDAATGNVVRVLETTKGVDEFLVSDGVLVAMVDPNTPAEIRRGSRQPTRVVAISPDTGERLWEHTAETILPLTMMADGKQVVYHDGNVIHSIGLRTGKARWVSPPTGQKIEHRASSNCDSPGAEKETIILAPQFAPTMVIYGGVVAFAGGRQLNVVSAEDGHELWRSPYASSSYSTPVDLFGFRDSLWGPDPAMNLWRPLDDDLSYKAFDPLTGAAKQGAKGHYGFRFQHHRCYQMKVVDDTVLGSRAGIEFLNTDTSEIEPNHWIRGSCFYGIMPANGLLYVPPHNCACYIRAKLTGFMALRANPYQHAAAIPADQRLQRGPAYGQTKAEAPAVRPDDWPTYRHDMGRSGRASTTVGSDLLLGWRMELGDVSTSPVVAGNRVYLAATDAHRLQALDASTGRVLWERVLDARIDSPPTVSEGLVTVGCRDGSVAALRATDGALVWRFRACPEERLIVSRGQLESVWPVHGSVLVRDGKVYVAAGKSSYLDGGLRFYALDLHTGRPIAEKTITSRKADGSETMDDEGVDGYLNDILSSDGERIFMRHQILDAAGNAQPGRVSHLHNPDGFLSFDTTSRLLWTYAPVYTSPHQGAFYDVRLCRALFPSGRILVEDKDTIFGFGQNYYEKMKVVPGGTWALFSSPKKSDVPLDLTAKQYRQLALSGKKEVAFNWWKRLPIQVWSMVQTDDALFVAGPIGGGTASPAALKGKGGAKLLAISPTDGEVLADMSLPSPPVWDGMAAAGGSLYLSLLNGDVVCLWSAASGRPGKPLSPTAWLPELPPLKLAKEPGLIGRWRFDEGLGPVARDCSGNEFLAQVSGRWAEGAFGTCLVANGNPRTVVIPDDKKIQFGTEDFTLAFWVKVDRYDVRLLGKEAFPENWWVINLPPDGHAELVLGEGRGNGLSVRPKTKGTVATDAWSHLVAVVDRTKGEVRWYLNGKLDSQTPIPKTMTKGLNSVGADLAIPSTHKPFQGLIGDLRIYRKALAGERVQKLFAEGTSRYQSTDFRIKEE